MRMASSCCRAWSGGNPDRIWPARSLAFSMRLSLSRQDLAVQAAAPPPRARPSDGHRWSKPRSSTCVNPVPVRAAGRAAPLPVAGETSARALRSFSWREPGYPPRRWSASWASSAALPAWWAPSSRTVQAAHAVPSVKPPCWTRSQNGGHSGIGSSVRTTLRRTLSWASPGAFCRDGPPPVSGSFPDLSPERILAG